MNRIQRTRITFEILTKASEPLELDDTEKVALLEALERAVSSHVDMRYYPESRYSEERHDLIGADIIEVTTA